MDYEPTGITLGRVWFEAGTKALAAVKLICERAGYRFWFAFDGIPRFKPAPVATSPVFTFTSAKHVQDPGVNQDLAEIRNRIVIEGIEQAMCGMREDRQSSRLTGEASAELEADELEKTHSIKNHLFQDQLSIDTTAEALLATFKDPKWYAEPKTPFNPVPLELGDTIAWPMELAAATEPGGEPIVVELTGIIRDIEIDLGQVAYKCEIVPAGMEAHALLSATHPDTEDAAPQLGDIVLASGDAPAPEAAGSPEHELLSEMHEDTEPAAPVAADVIMASGDPVRWRRLPVGNEGQILKIVDGAPTWATLGLVSSQWSVAKQSASATNNDFDNFVNVPGLGFSLTSGHRNYFRFIVEFQIDDVSRGPRWAFTRPAMTYQHYSVQGRQGSIGVSGYYFGDAADLTSIINGPQQAPAINIPYWSLIEGICQPSENGALQLTFSTEIDDKTITINNGGVGMLCDLG